MSAVSRLKERLISILRWSERYTKTDMVYLASGAFWSNFNSAIMIVLSFLASLFFAHFLTKDQYGTYQYVLAIAGLVSGLTLTGMNSAVTRAVARGHEGELKHSVSFQLKASVVPFIVGLGISAWYLFHGNHSLAFAFLWVAIFLPLGSTFNTWVAYLGGKKLFRVGSYYGLANNLLGYLPILAAIYFARNYLWVVFVNYFFSFAASFIIYQVVIRKIPPNTERDNETISYGTHLSFMSIVGTVIGQLDTLLVFHFLGSVPTAVYSFATIIPEKLAGALKFIPNIAMPKLAPMDEAQIRHIIFKRLWVLIAIVLIAAGCYTLLAPLLFHTFFPAYSDSIRFTQVYSLALFSLVPTFLQTALTAQRKTRELYIVNSVNPILRVILLSVLMFFFGIWGLLWAQILLNFTSFGIQLTLIARTKRNTI